MTVSISHATPQATSGRGFLAPPNDDDRTGELYRRDREALGFVMNLTRLWAQVPDAVDGFGYLVGVAARGAGLTVRQRSVLISACAGTLQDSYCSLVWGAKLAGYVGPSVAASVLAGDDAGLDAEEKVLARWARLVSSRPNDTTEADVDELRATGRTDQQIFSLTLFVALRAAFASVNDALGVGPDAAVLDSAPPEVRDAVAFGRPGTGSVPGCA